MLRAKSLGVLTLALVVSACNAAGGAAPAPVFIRGAQGRFDPTVSVGPQIAGLHTELVGRLAPYIVQYQGHVTVAERQGLKHAGALIVAYQPDNALLVRIAPKAARTLRHLSGVRAVVAQSPALRLQPALLVRADGHLVPTPSLEPVELLVEVTGEDAQVAVAQDVGAMGGKLDQLSSSGRYVSVTLPAAAAAELAARSDVLWVQKANHFHVLNDQARWVIQAGSGSANVGKTPVWDHGITGKGQIIGIADSGINTANCFFADVPNKILKYEILSNGQYTATKGDEIGHGTHTSGSLAGNTTNATYSKYDGQAKDAQLYFQDASNQADAAQGSLSALPNDLNAGLFPNPYAAGARVHSDSWGGQTSSYDANAAQVDQFVAAHPDMLVVFANGNAGPNPGTVGSPATAKDLISVGATENPTATTPDAAEDMAVAYNQNFSSRGPTADGRIKPTLTAPGAMINSADYQSTCGVKADAGTSMATPTLAGGATLAREYFTDGFYPSGAKNSADALQPSAALLKAVLIAGADAMTGPTAGKIPGMDQGFGRVNIGHSLYFTGDYAKDRLWIHDAKTGINTGDAPTFTLTTDRAGPLKVALTWTDPAASAGANPALVNDLDLTVKAPDGTVYAGNAMQSGQSVAGGTADHKNVEELVYLPSAAQGTFTVTVKGDNVPQGPQTFALAAVGEVVVSGQGAPVNDPPGPPPPPPPPTKCTDATVSPLKADVGWVDSLATTQANFFGDDDIYVSNGPDSQNANGDRYGVIQVPINVQRGQTLDHLSLTVTTQTAAWLQPGTSFTFDAIDMPALSTSTTYSDIKNASVLATSPDAVDDTMISQGQPNTVTFPPKAVSTGGLLTVRIHATASTWSMTSWDSGYPTTASSGDSTPGLGIPPVVGLCWKSSTPPPPPTALKMNTVGDQTGAEAQPLDIKPTLASDPKVATPVWTATGLPQGANLNGGTGEITWTPTYQQAGTYPMTLTVTEGSATDSQSFKITINNTPRAPVFTPVPDQTVQAGNTVTFQVSAPDPDGDAVRITVTAGPSAASFDGHTFTWTPTSADVGTHTVTFDATTIDGDSVTMDVHITVTQGAGGTDGGTVGSDGGTPGGTDGGTPAGSDGGTATGSDGGTGNGGGNQNGNAPDAPSCACSATQGSPTGLLPLAFGLLGLAALRRRRRA